MQKSKYFRFTLVGEGGYIQPLNDLMTALDGELADFRQGNVGEEITIKLEVIEMSDEEYQKLPDFQGW